MDHHNHVEEAIKLAGGLSAVGRHFRITAWAVKKWITKLPPDRVIPLCELVEWQKTPHQLLPSHYPNANDGLPETMRRPVAPPAPASADLLTAQGKAVVESLEKKPTDGEG